MLAYWTGGGAPKDTQTMTIGAETPEELRERAIEWIDAHIFDKPPRGIHPPARPMAMWPALEDFEEDLTDAAA